MTETNNQTARYAIQHIWCLSLINWEGSSRKGIWHKIWGIMEVGASMVQTGGVQPDCRHTCLSYLPHAS